MVSTAHELYLKTLQGDLNWVKSLLTPQAMAKVRCVCDCTNHVYLNLALSLFAMLL